MIKILEALRYAFRKPTREECLSKELAEAYSERLEAQTAVEFATSVVDYNTNRIKRLTQLLEEYK
jgi:hypothetical protein